MAGAVFHSIGKLCAQIFNPAMADRSVLSVDCHNENGHTADCQSLKSTFESGSPSAGFILGLRARVGNPQDIGELIAKEIILWWQSAELERGG
jgi:hypothetical protein